MLTASAELLRELQAKINILTRDPSASLARTEKILVYINQTLISLKEMIRSYTFAEPEEEVKFFKEINPEFYALWIYYSSVYSIQSHTFPGSSKSRIKYLEHETKRIDDFFFHHLDFYKYFRGGKTHRDREYFMRSPEMEELFTDTYAAVIDRQLCTPHSLKIATIIANERLRVYINNAVTEEANKGQQQNKQDGVMQLQWTESKTSLIEIIYAFYAAKVFNNGDATIEAITRYCEKVFYIELKAHTITFQEILRRKKGLASALEWIKNKYLMYIDTVEERNRIRRTKK